jgi:hypothetical protein
MSAHRGCHHSWSYQLLTAVVWSAITLAIFGGAAVAVRWLLRSDQYVDATDEPNTQCSLWLKPDVYRLCRTWEITQKQSDLTAKEAALPDRPQAE